jgi:glyoxylase-like metal-dependent hydrolase (beta-lactamase superfamily II)
MTRLAGFLAIAVVAGAQSGVSGLDVLHVQGNVYLVAGAGGNVTVQIGPAGVLLVDTGNAASAENLLAAVRKLSSGRIRYIVNTHVHPDHTGGNEAAARAGGSSGVRSIRGTPGESLTEMPQVLAHDNVLQRMVAPAPGQAPVPETAHPTTTWVGSGKDLFFNGETIQMIHQPSGHTDGDSIVHFRRSDVISAGDILNMDTYPVIDLARGGSVQGVIDGLNRLLDLAVPEHHEEGGTYIIPGHGRVCDEFDLVEYRDMVTIIRDRVQAMIRKGATLEQVRIARPSRDYDPRFGATTGPWTTDLFLEAVYKSLAQR